MMTQLKTFTPIVLLVLLVLSLAACGGGGGSGSGSGGNSTPFTLSASTLTFSAASPTADMPAEQTIQASYTGPYTGTLYYSVRVTQSDTNDAPLSYAVANITNFSGTGSTQQASVRVRAPDILGTRTATSTITVIACVNDPLCLTGELPGSPKTFTINYTIGSQIVPPDTVMPHLAVTGIGGSVVIRGRGFAGASSVRFGPIAATTFTVVSDTEIRASYPPLANGSYPIVLNSGNIPFSGAILAHTPIVAPAEALAFPEGPLLITFVRYDAERRAILVGWRNSNPTTNKIARYTYNGASTGSVWNMPTLTTIAGLNDVCLSADGSRLYATGTDGLIELSPDLLTIHRTTPRPGLSSGNPAEILTTIGVANNGFAMVGANFSSFYSYPSMYYYSTSTGVFSLMGLFAGDQPRPPIATTDGAKIFGGVRGVLPSQPMMEFNASTSTRRFIIASDQRQQLSTNRDGSLIIIYEEINGSPNGSVYSLGTTSSRLGFIPEVRDPFFANDHVEQTIMNPQGTRVYTVNSNRTLRTYALDQPTVHGDFPQVGSAVTLLPPPVTGSPFDLLISIAISPDGGTLFIANVGGLIVMPAPQ